jgi:meso-butanediol dehydrogenase/(S,S)-butanediol dehydrogenase/diacetyl reductase
MEENTRLRDTVAIVTGGASGIGSATVARFLAEGASVVVADLRGGSLVFPEELRDRVVGIDCDVTREEDARHAVATAQERFGGLNVLVNSAGITGAPGRIHEYDVEAWDRVFDVNVRGAFLMMRAAIPPMLGTGGSIVTLASVGAFVHAGAASAYAPSKGAVLMLSRQAAIDYAKDGIRVNAVCPGLVNTPILDGAPGGPEELGRFVPIGRLGEPGEIAALIAYLASAEAGFVTGSAMLIDGGMTAI